MHLVLHIVPLIPYMLHLMAVLLTCGLWTSTLDVCYILTAIGTTSSLHTSSYAPCTPPPPQGDDVKALIQDALPASLPPSITPSVKDSDGSKANVAAIGLTVAGASLLTNEYLPSSGDGSDKPVRKRKCKGESM